MIRNFYKRIYFLITGIFMLVLQSYAQPDLPATAQYDQMKLPDLLKQRIANSTANQGLQFADTLSIQTIYRDEILKSGSNSIMEALMLIPGVIVRQQTNGNYDVQLRGLDHLPPASTFDHSISSDIVLMVNNRPIVKYLNQGISWESLSINVNDIEKIEVAKGSSAIYRTNSTSGIINIVTRQMNKDGLNLSVMNRKGTYKTLMNSIAMGYKFKNNLQVNVTANLEHRDRTQTAYFDYYQNQWAIDPEKMYAYTNGEEAIFRNRYPQPSTALNRQGLNIFSSYQPSKNLQFNLSTGLQNSFAQKVATENLVTPLSTITAESKYVDLYAQYKNLELQTSYTKGEHTQIYSINKYHFNSFNTRLQYTYAYKALTIKPAINVSSIKYHGFNALQEKYDMGIINGKARLTNINFSIGTQYKLPDNKLTLSFDVIASKYNYPAQIYLSFTGAAAYQLNEKSVIKISYAKTQKSPGALDIYSSKVLASYKTDSNTYYRYIQEGDKQLKLQTANTAELSYNLQLNPFLKINAEAFFVQPKNYHLPVVGEMHVKYEGADTIYVTPFKLQTLPMKVWQGGITISVNYAKNKIRIKPTLTYQQTRISNYTAFANIIDAGQQSTGSAIHDYTHSTVLKSTPALFGSATFTYLFSSRLNINVAPYYYSSQVFTHISSVYYPDDNRGIDAIKSKLNLNATVSYQVIKGLTAYCTGKNILHNGSAEFFKSDQIPFMLLGGINYRF